MSQYVSETKTILQGCVFVQGQKGPPVIKRRRVTVFGFVAWSTQPVQILARKSVTEQYCNVEPISAEHQLANALAECARLRAENRDLRQRLGLPKEQASIPRIVPAVLITDSLINSKSSPDEKVGLFRSLFRGREDVYAVRWEGRNGKTGYSPAYRKVWSNPFQRKPDEPKEYFPLTAHVIHDHLTGKLTAGVYPLLTDETCWFLAADFDKATWQDDVLAFLQTCADWRIPAALERSRSWCGGHVWVFFDAPLPASLARKLGAAILTRTMECRHQLGLDSYDRLFPSQDTMPRSPEAVAPSAPRIHIKGLVGLFDHGHGLPFATGRVGVLNQRGHRIAPDGQAQSTAAHNVDWRFALHNLLECRS